MISAQAARKTRIATKELVLFAMFGTVMFCSKVIMAGLPNIKLIAMFIITFTVVYRKKALIPIYIYVSLEGMFYGFAAWWVAYLYVWAILWGIAMLLPKNMPKKIAVPVYMIVCALHGLSFGTLCAFSQAPLFGLSFEGMIAWIVAGLPFDFLHAAGNLVAGTLVVPFAALLTKLNRAFNFQ